VLSYPQVLYTNTILGFSGIIFEYMPDANIILLIIALFLILIYWISAFIIFYHLVRFGVGTQPKIISAVFVLGSLVLFFVSTVIFSGIDTSRLNGELHKIEFNTSVLVNPSEY